MPITPTVSRDVGERDGSTALWTWILVTATPDGSPLEWSEWADRTWQATGTFGGATVTIEGSNDGATWFPLTNAAGAAAATFAAAGGKAVIETPRYVRPNLTVVGAGASITVTLFGRRNTPLRT